MYYLEFQSQKVVLSLLNYLNIICEQIILSDKTNNPPKSLASAKTARMQLFLCVKGLDSMRADKDLWLKQMTLFGLSTCFSHNNSLGYHNQDPKKINDRQFLERFEYSCKLEHACFSAQILKITQGHRLSTELVIWLILLESAASGQVCIDLR